MYCKQLLNFSVPHIFGSLILCRMISDFFHTTQKLIHHKSFFFRYGQIFLKRGAGLGNEKKCVILRPFFPGKKWGKAKLNNCFWLTVALLINLILTYQSKIVIFVKSKTDKLSFIFALYNIKEYIHYIFAHGHVESPFLRQCGSSSEG